MCKHEEKICPRCNRIFECKAGDVGQCQCFGIALTIEASSLMEERYTDCLCRNCLLDLKHPSGFFKEKFFYNR